MSWVTNAKPAKKPPPPKVVSLLTITTALTQAPIQTEMQTYLQSQLPEQPLDRWGQPLPLSSVQQDRLNRLVAVLSDPYTRGQALLKSGTLDTIETNALKDGCPEVYARIRTEARMAMIEAGPPLPLWVEAVLGVLFCRDAALVYGESDAKQSGGNNSFLGKAPMPTPADLTSEHSLRK